MKRRTGLIGQVGYIMVMVGIVTLLANSPERPITAALWMITGILVALCAALSKSKAWLEITSLVAISIAVLLYFFTENQTLTNFFLAFAVLVGSVDMINRYKNRTSLKQPEKT